MCSYIFNDPFGDCRGCVRSINFCYTPFSLGKDEELMTIEIRNNGNVLTDSYRVIVNTTRDRTNCPERYGLGVSDCCVEPILTEPFLVSSQSSHYALRIPRDPPGFGLRHQTQIVAGHQEDLNGNAIPSPVYNPLFYFVIDPSDGML